MFTKGDGTRTGKGTCKCDAGYGGDICNECIDGYFEEAQNDTDITCAGEYRVK